MPVIVLDTGAFYDIKINFIHYSNEKKNVYDKTNYSNTDFYFEICMTGKF